MDIRLHRLYLEIKSPFTRIYHRFCAAFTAWKSIRIHAIHSAKITPKHVVVTPTLHGARFFAVWLIMLLVCLNYQSNLGLLFVFLLLSIVIVSSFFTYRNLVGVKLTRGKVAPAFVGQDCYYPIIVSDESKIPRETIRFRWQAQDRVSLTIPAGGESCVEVPIPARTRGRFNPGYFLVYTQYPFGLLQAWTWVMFDSPFIVYPRPIKSGLHAGYQDPIPKTPYNEGLEDFDRLRSYIPGDSLKHIAWKSLAKSHNVHTKVFVSTDNDTQWIDWSRFGPSSEEETISYLTQAVLDAHEHGESYGLKMPHLLIEPGKGESHKHQCLTALALYGANL